MLKILHVVPTYLPAKRYGGPIRSVHSLCKALVEAGNQVDVCTTNVDGAGESNVEVGVPNYIDGVRVWYFESVYGRRIYWSNAMRTFIKKNIKNYDIVHSHAVFLWPGWYSTKQSRLQKVPFVVSPRGMLVPSLIEKRGRIRKRLSIALFDKPALQKADAVHFTTVQEEQECLSLGIKPRNSIIIPNGVDVQSSQPDTVEVVTKYGLLTPYVLYLGRLNWKKGIDRLIQAICGLQKLHLVIAGNDEDGYKKYLDIVIKDQNCNSQVRFLGEVTGKDKWSLLAGAEVLVLPSISENLGNVVLEALAVSTPVIVSKGVGLAETISHSGAGLVCDGSPFSIRNCIEYIQENPSKAAEMSALGIDLVKTDFNWKSVAAKMHSEYTKLVGNPKAGMTSI